MIRHLFLSCLAGLFLSVSAIGAEGLVPPREDGFILGVYSADAPGPLDYHFRLLREAGINYVQTYGAPVKSDPASVKYCRDFLDTAQKYGLKVMFSAPSRKLLMKENGVDLIVESVREFRNHPALGMWYMADEPEASKFPLLTELTEKLHQMSPKIPCTIVEMWAKDWWKMGRFCDVVMVDFYPVRGEIFPTCDLSLFCKFIYGASRLKKQKNGGFTPLIPVLQMCDFTDFKNQVKNPENRKRLRFPNAAEMNFMSWSSIAYGVRGLFFYSYYRSHLDRPGSMQWFTGCFTPLVSSVRTFSALAHPVWQVTARQKKLEQDHKVVFSYWKRDRGEYLVLLNNSAEVRDIELKWEADSGFPEKGVLTPLFQTRSADVVCRNNSLVLKQIQPWETFVWRVEK